MEICYMTAREVAAKIRTKELSPVEVLEAVLARVAEVNPRILAYCTLAEEQARATAKAAEQAVMQGEKLGVLHGVPFGVKDLANTAGIRTTFASHIFANNVPKEDATHVKRVRDAGGVIVGKTATPEFGAGANTFSSLFGISRNPWDIRVTTAGSSGGSASALASGMGFLATGSDLGGSLRTPASFCNVVGFRPTPGRVSNYPSGSVWNPLPANGPMARNVGDVALMLAVMSGRDERDPTSFESNPDEFTAAVQKPDVKGWRVAWSADLGFAPMDKTVAAFCEKAAQVFATELGCSIEAAHPDLHDAPHIFQVLRASGMAAGLGDYLSQWRDKMQPNLVWNIEKGLTLSAVEVGKADITRGLLWQRANRFFDKYDLLITPAAAVPPFPVETISPPEVDGRKMETYVDWLGIAYGITLAGLPAIIVPCGFNADGLPIGLQIAGKALTEAKILKAAAAFEQAKPHFIAQRPQFRG